MNEQELDLQPVIEKPSLAERIHRDRSARHRRKQIKEAVSLHSYKEEKEARERLKAKRRLEKQKRQKLKKTG